MSLFWKQDQYCKRIWIANQTEVDMKGIDNADVVCGHEFGGAGMTGWALRYITKVLKNDG